MNLLHRLVCRSALWRWKVETLADLAMELGISRERVRQLQNEAEQLLKFGTRRVPRRSVA